MNQTLRGKSVMEDLMAVVLCHARKHANSINSWLCFIVHEDLAWPVLSLTSVSVERNVARLVPRLTCPARDKQIFYFSSPPANIPKWTTENFGVHDECISQHRSGKHGKGKKKQSVNGKTWNPLPRLAALTLNKSARLGVQRECGT